MNKFNDEKVRKVLVLYTGGTIGMLKNSKGAYVPEANRFITKIKNTPQMHNEDFAKKYFGETTDEMIIPNLHNNFTVIYLIKEYDPLLDSSNMSIYDWMRIAKDVEENYSKYDGFVILHGTDTLTYTASALSFMLDGLQKPVILTGAQIPIFESRNDAKDNFMSSLTLAACYNIPEVCIFFANKLFRGNRTAKISSDLLEAFSTPNYHILANIGIQVAIFPQYIKKYSYITPFKVYTTLNPNVGLLYIFPTITYEMIQAFFHPLIEGVVLGTYGSGNIPLNRKDIIDVFKDAVKRGVIIVSVTQCSQGAVSPSYEGGYMLNEIGIISGHDMTTEAALSKLSFILGLPGLTLQQRKQLIESNIRGELSNHDDK